MTTLQQAMFEALTDESLHDVVLRGTDGITVEANKAVLAIRSPVFKRMFFSDFQKTYENPLNYPSIVLRVLVKFCYTDELDLDLIYDDDEEAVGLSDTEAVHMVQLRDAANYFELPALHRGVTDELGSSIAQKSDLGCICAVLGELWERRETEGPFWAILTTLVQMHPQKSLLPTSSKWNKGIVACPASLLSNIVSNIGGFAAAQSLQTWCNAYPDIFEETNESNQVKEQLHQLAERVDLVSIPAHQLKEIKPSHLFSMERLYQAFVEQANKSPRHAAQQQGTGNVAQANGNLGIQFYSGFMNLKINPGYAIVEGAGVKCLDGVYRNNAYPSPFGGGEGKTYSREGFYGEEKCTFKLLHYPDFSGPDSQPWKLVVCFSNGRQHVFYESKPPPDKEVPFSTWICCDGKAPAPFVAVGVAEFDEERIPAGAEVNPPSAQSPRRKIRASRPRS